MIQIDNNKLRELYKNDGRVKIILDFIQKNYVRNMTDTSVAQLRKTKLSDGEIKDAMRQLEALNVGRYLPGRWKKVNRFEWATSMTEVAAVATGKKDYALESIADGIAASMGEASTEMTEKKAEIPANAHKHSFSLRPDFVVDVVLPTDFNTTEAKRFNDFLKTLPFEPDTATPKASKASHKAA